MDLRSLIMKARAEKDPKAEGLTRLADAGFVTVEQVRELLPEPPAPKPEKPPKPKKKGKKK